MYSTKIEGILVIVSESLSKIVNMCCKSGSEEVFLLTAGCIDLKQFIACLI
jgi:hypothetical protein